jgi:hypothetical protein
VEENRSRPLERPKLKPDVLHLPRRVAHVRSARRVRPTRRLLVRLHRRRLDRELAYGRVDLRNEDLALRARQLTDPRTRLRLARSLRRVAADAERVPRATVAAPLPSAVTGEWGGALEGLADRLDQPAPISAAAVARMLALLSDGSGPLYSTRPTRTMSDFVWWIADGLVLCPPHQWRCPVVTKVEPHHVAWTCVRCGALGVSDDLATGPG